MKRVFVWHQGALGDLLLSVSALNAIKRQWDGARLHLVSRTDIAPLLVRAGLADDFSSCEEGIFSSLFTEDETIPARLADFLAGFDAAVIFSRRINPDVLRKVGAVIPDPVSVMTFPPEGLREHVSAYQLMQLGITGDPAFRLPEKYGDGLPPSQRPVIAVHPGSGGSRKCWPVENFFDLMLLFHRKRRCRFLVTFGPAEGADVMERTARFISENEMEAEVVGSRALTEIAGLLSEAVFYIGNDSGMSHFAAFLGIPSIVLFGPTDHVVWGPLGKNVRIVRSGIDCSPCSEERSRFCHGIQCMKEIRVADVLQVADELQGK